MTIASSPYAQNAFTPATPVSLALEMMNWLDKKIQEISKVGVDRGEWPPVMGELLKEAKPGTEEKIRDMLNNWNSKIQARAGPKNTKKIELLYFKVAEEMLAQE